MGYPWVQNRSDGCDRFGWPVLRAVLSVEGHRTGERGFGAFFPGDVSMMGTYVAAAFASDGTLIDDLPMS